MIWTNSQSPCQKTRRNVNLHAALRDIAHARFTAPVTNASKPSYHRKLGDVHGIWPVSIWIIVPSRWPARAADARRCVGSCVRVVIDPVCCLGREFHGHADKSRV